MHTYQTTHIKHLLSTLSHHIVPHWLLQKSTLLPFFSPVICCFSLLCVTCCFSMYGAVWNLIFFIHILCSVAFDAFYFCLPLLHSTHIMTGAFILTASAAVLNFSCLLYLHSCFLSVRLFVLYFLSFPSSTLFYMFCRGICGSFFLFALFHFLCRAVVRSVEVLSPQPRGPVRLVEAVDSCLRPLQHPGPMLLTPL